MKWDPPHMLGKNEKFSLVAKTPKQLHWLFNELERASEFAFDIETSHATSHELEYHKSRTEAKVLGIAFSWAENRGAYIPLYKNGEGEPYFKDPVIFQSIISRLKQILENPETRKIAHNGKFDCTYLYFNFNIFVQNFEFDTMIAHWIINENGEHENWAGVRTGVGHGLDKVAIEYLKTEAGCSSEYDLLQQEVIVRDPRFKRYEVVPLDILGRYANFDAIDTYKVYKHEYRILEERNQLDFFFNHEMMKTRILIRAEIEGLPTKTEKIPEVIAYLDAKMHEVRTDLATKVGFDFDPAHTDNTVYVLFEILKLKPIGDKGKSGSFSTKKAVLEKYAKLEDKTEPQPIEVSIPRGIITYRNLSRMKTNYAEAVHQYIDYKKKLFHMNYKQTGTDTGRLSAAIIHSMPSEKKGGKIVKSLFWAGGKPGIEQWFANTKSDEEKERILEESGNVFVFSDFSQIELRVMAELSRDPAMVAAFQAGEDIHTAAAKRILGVTDAWIKDPANKAEFAEIRRRAKTINFGILFGEGPSKLAQDLGIEVEEAKALVKSYFKAYPYVEAYIGKVYKEAEITGQIRNMFGRIRHLDDIKHLASIEIPRYKNLMLTEEEQKLFYGRLSGVDKPPSCYLGEDKGIIFPPTISGHLGYDMMKLVAGRRPPKTEALRAKLVSTSHGQNYKQCASCPYLAPCAWEGEISRRRMKLQRMRRQAFSSMIQSSAVDLCMFAMASIQDKIMEEKIPAHGTRFGLAVQALQVHDEIGVIVAKSHASRMSQIVKEEMERWPNSQFPDFVTPIRADPSKPVSSWADAEK